MRIYAPTFIIIRHVKHVNLRDISTFPLGRDIESRRRKCILEGEDRNNIEKRKSNMDIKTFNSRFVAVNKKKNKNKMSGKIY